MKVLVAHNRYRSDAPSGENRVVDSELQLLQHAGVEAVPFLYSSDALVGASARATLLAGAGPVYALPGVRDFRSALDKHRPDVIHLHNVFPMISPYVIRVAAQRDIPVVHTVHNFRHSCLNGVHLRAGSVCTACVGRKIPTAALRHGCYRDSRLQTVAMTVGQILHHSSWRMISRFLALTPFMRSLLIEHGLPAERIVVRPGWVEDTGPASTTGHDYLFVGRLDEAKGILLLLEAWSRTAEKKGRVLRIAGDGPLAQQVREVAAQRDDVIFLGRLQPSEIATAMESAACVVAPSLCFEGYGLVLAEAFARGRGVVTVSGGSMATTVNEDVGWVCAPQADALAATLSRLSDAEMAKKGVAARQHYERENSPAVAAKTLLALYRDVVVQPRLGPARGPSDAFGAPTRPSTSRQPSRQGSRRDRH